MISVFLLATNRCLYFVSGSIRDSGVARIFESIFSLAGGIVPNPPSLATPLVRVAMQVRLQSLLVVRPSLDHHVVPIVVLL